MGIYICVCVIAFVHVSWFCFTFENLVYVATINSLENYITHVSLTFDMEYVEKFGDCNIFFLVFQLKSLIFTKAVIHLIKNTVKM